MCSGNNRDNNSGEWAGVLFCALVLVTMYGVRSCGG